jgi:hypothetical protein
MTHTLFAKTVAVGLVVMIAGTARGQGADPDAARALAKTVPAMTATKALTEEVNRRPATGEFRPLASDWQAAPSTKSASQSRSAVRRTIGYAFAGALAGMLAGAGIGSTLTQNCRCHDPGSGALLGMPIGIALGATFGVWLAGR